MEHIYTFTYKIVATDYHTAKQTFSNACLKIKDVEEIFDVEAEEFNGADEEMDF